MKLKLSIFFIISFLAFKSNAKEILNHDSAYHAYISLYDSASEAIISNPKLSAHLFKKSYLALELVLRSEKSNGSFSKFNEKGRILVKDYESMIGAKKLLKNINNHSKSEILSAYKTLINSGNWYDKSQQVEWAHKGINYAKEIKDTTKIIRWTIFLGDANNHLVLPANAENNFNTARSYLDEFSGEKKSLEIFWLQRYASLRNNLHDVVESIKFSNRALELIENDSQQVGVSLNELGYSYSVLLENDTAKRLFKGAIKCWYPNNKNLSIAYLNLSNIYLREGDTFGAKPFLNNALYFAQRDGVTWVSRSANGKIGNLHYTSGNIELAYQYEIIGRHLTSFENRLNKANEILKVEVEYEMSERLREIQEKESELILKKQENKEQNRKLALAVALFVLAIIAVLAIAFYSRVLKSRGKRLEAQQKLIEEKNSQLIEAAELNETLLKEVHHRVKNNLTILSGLFYFEEKEQDDPALKLFLKECNNRIHSMALVHQQLYGSDDLSKIDFESYVNHLTKVISSSIKVPEKKLAILLIAMA